MQISGISHLQNPHVQTAQPRGGCRPARAMRHVEAAAYAQRRSVSCAFSPLGACGVRSYTLSGAHSTLVRPLSGPESARAQVGAGWERGAGVSLAARVGNARVTASRITLRPRERKGTQLPSCRPDGTRRCRYRLPCGPACPLSCWHPAQCRARPSCARWRRSGALHKAAQTHLRLCRALSKAAAAGGAPLSSEQQKARAVRASCSANASCAAARASAGECFGARRIVRRRSRAQPRSGVQ
jgi:hypothetical protein